MNHRLNWRNLGTNLRGANRNRIGTWGGNSYIKLELTSDRLRSFVRSISFVRFPFFVRFPLSILFVRFRSSYRWQCAIAALSSIDGCIVSLVCGNR